MQDKDFSAGALLFFKSISLFNGLPLKTLKRVIQHSETRNYHTGDEVYRRGEISKYIYIIKYGEIAIEFDSGHEKYLGSGEVLSETSILTEAPHSTTARSVLDSMLYAIEGKYFIWLAEREKQLSQNLVRLLGTRMRLQMEEPKLQKQYRRIICHLPLEPMENFYESIKEVAEQGKLSAGGTSRVVNLETLKKLSHENMLTTLSEMRKVTNQIHLYSEYKENYNEIESLITQATKIIFWEKDPEKYFKNKQLLLETWRNKLRNKSIEVVKYLSSTEKNITFKISKEDHRFREKEILARHLVSKKRGLALGGGGARALAHVGLLRVLEKENIHFDYISGASFGAVIGALLARKESVINIEKLIENFFGGIDTPFDPTLPLVSFFRGKKMKKMLRDAFGTMMIEDLEIPFVTSAVDLHSGEEYIFDRGPIWEALLSAMSLPGIFPPHFLGENLLIDGGVINNVPENLIKEKGADIILSVNVSPMRDENLFRLLEEKSITSFLSPKYLWENLKYPPILKIMGRSISLEGREIVKLKKSRMDLFLQLHLEEFTLFDFGEYKEIINKGEKDSLEYLDEIQKLFFPGK